MKTGSFFGTCYIRAQLRDFVFQKILIRDFNHKYSTTGKLYAVIIKLHILSLFYEQIKYK